MIKAEVVLSPEECQRLVGLYDLERYLLSVVSPRYAQEGTLSSCDFYAIVIWKSNRAKTGIKRGLAAKGLYPLALMRKVSQTKSLEGKVDVLLDVPGIGLAMASAILTICCPTVYTVLDYRAWETLSHMSVEGLPKSHPGDSRGYIRYCQSCCHLAERLGLSLRDLDRVLWARNWEKDLLSLIGS